jgi:hypothetical protein
MMLDNIKIFQHEKSQEKWQINCRQSLASVLKSVKLIQKFIAYPKGYYDLGVGVGVPLPPVPVP